MVKRKSVMFYGLTFYSLIPSLIVSGMASLAARSLGRLAANRSFFFLCDMQEKFKSNIKYFPEIASVAQRLVGTKILEYTAT